MTPTRSWRLDASLLDTVAGYCLFAAGGVGEFGGGGPHPRRLAAAPCGAGWDAGGWVAGSGWGRTLPAVRGDALDAAGGGEGCAGTVGAGGGQGGVGRRPAAE